MKLTTILLATGLATSTNSLTLNKRGAGELRVLGFPLERRVVEDRVAHDKNRLRRRQDNTVGANVDNLETLYFLNASIGTPPQNFRLHVDTGSSDLWVNTDDSTFCSRSSNGCDISGTFNANDSSTYNYVGSYFNISYADGSGAAGDYATDTMRIGSTDVKDLQFGIGYTSSSPQSIVGIGYQSNEAATIKLGRETYENLPARLVSDGAIASSAYSLWLNDLESNEGTLLFGGVDRAQYEGDLVSLPIQGSRRQFLVTLNGVSVDGQNLGDNLGLAVLLDSGTSLTYLPDDIVSDIYQGVEAQFDQNSGAALVDCDLANENFNMTFSFGDSLTINVPISEMVLDVLSTSNQDSQGNGQPQGCLFGIGPAGAGGTTVLGDTFLRSAYLVFDLENNEISMAQSHFDATETDIAEIGTGSNAVPDAVAASGNIQATTGLPAATDSARSTNDSNDSLGNVTVPNLGGVLVTMVVALGIAAFLL